MKKYSKILSLAVSAILMLSCFGSCGNNADDKDSSSNSNSTVNSIESSNNKESAADSENSSSDSSKNTESKNEKNNNESSSGVSDDDALSGVTLKSYSVDTLTDPKASDEDKAEAFRLIMSVSVRKGAEASANVPGGQKIKENLNNGGNASNNNSGSTSKNNDDKTNSNNKNDNKTKPTTTTKKPNTTEKPPVKLNGDEKTFVITVYPKIAPKTAENFLQLVNDGFYNGMTFNRVIENFLAQAGDTDGNGTGTSEKTIEGEFSYNGFDNSLSHTKGVVSMNRNPNDPDSATSQFFICYNDECKFMDGNYAAFGKVTDGMSVVEDFQKIQTVTGKDGVKSKPVSDITIKLAEQNGKDSKGNPKSKFYVTY